MAERAKDGVAAAGTASSNGNARHDAATGRPSIPPPANHRRDMRALTLGALGVVFGDIGTSPLYAMKECITGPHGVPPTHANILGLLSLVFWALTMVITVKYVTFIMQADNKGEGGILALLALVPQWHERRNSVRIGWMTALVIFGAALLYGDGVITPAITVLGAIEGLEVATPQLKHVIVPIACIILAGLFWFQKKGTGGVGRVFGPVMVVWFLALGVLGTTHLLRHPSVLVALDPRYAINFFIEHGRHGFIVLGGVVLVVTGGEALCADMGHFGPRPIRIAWLGLVMPSLVLNYFGQGALLIEDPSAASNPFYALVPPGLIYPMTALSTAAAVIASQALISGAFSLTRQAIQLGFFPRVTIVHTSESTEGQIYIPEINAALAIACVLVVLGFKESNALAGAYGVAVTGTMSITSIIYFVVLKETWRWSLLRAVPLVGAFLVFDLAFFGSNLMKFFGGGWLPVAIAFAIFTVMTTWKRGRAILGNDIRSRMLPAELFLQDLEQNPPHRVPGTAVFMSSTPHDIPIVLLHHWKHNQVLHDTVVLLSVVSETVPQVAIADRVRVEKLPGGFYRVVAHYGFMQTPNVPAILARAHRLHGVPFATERTSYYLGREILLPTGRSNMNPWRKRLFGFISRNARSATQYFGIPPDRVVELGMQIAL
jgi:KUP system potassium uptake protein